MYLTVQTCRRHEIMVASHFNGWVIYAGAMVLGRANAWSENADPEGRQATRGSAFACGKLKRGGSDLFSNAQRYKRVIRKEFYGTALSGR